MSNLSTLFDRYKALVVFDTETSGLDFDNDQIIELAALRVERTATGGLRIAGKMDTFIKLPEGETLPENIVSLTGITDELLAQEGIPFPEAYARFKRFAGGLPCYSHAWQPDDDRIADGKVIGYNLDMFGIKDDSPLDCRNIAGWFKQAYRKNGIFVEKQSSGQIAKLLGLEDEIRALGLDEHNAFYDVHSILAGLRHLGFAQTI